MCCCRRYEDLSLYLGVFLISVSIISAVNIISDYYMQPGIGYCGTTISGTYSAFVRSHIGAYQTGSISITSYQNNIASCTVSYDAGPGRQVLIQFSQFELEAMQNGVCVDKLFVYDTSSTTTPYLTKCGSSAIHSFSSTGRNITLEFTTNSNTTHNGFKLLLTTFRFETANCTSSEFKCDSTSCIDNSLKCDGTSHCVDGTDEDRTIAGCTLFDEIVGSITSLGTHTVLAIAILAGSVVLTVFITVIVYQVWCKKKKDNNNDTNSDKKTPTKSTKSPKKSTVRKNVIAVAPKPKNTDAWSKKSTKKEEEDFDF